MPQFLVRVFTQCAVPDTTPDLDNTEVKLPRRMLYENPPFLATLLTRAANAVSAADAYQAALSVVPQEFQLGLVNEPFVHVEREGVYIKNLQPGEPGETVFVLQTTQNGAPQPYTRRVVIPAKTTLAGANMTSGDLGGTTRNIPVEFRVHLVVRAI